MLPDTRYGLVLASSASTISPTAYDSALLFLPLMRATYFPVYSVFRGCDDRDKAIENGDYILLQKGSE